MEDWTEANLTRLSVKELKSLARKSNVNPNCKKADLVKALLTYVNDAGQSETIGGQTSRRMTRSRVPYDLSDNVKATKTKLNDNVNSEIKDHSNKRMLRASENIDLYDTSEMFPLVSSIQLPFKPLLEITNTDIVRHEQNKQEESKDQLPPKRGKRNNVQSKSIEGVLIQNNADINGVNSDIDFCLIINSNQEKDCDLNSTFVVEEKESTTQDIRKGSKKRNQAGIKLSIDVKESYSLKGLDEKVIVGQIDNDSKGTETVNSTELEAKVLSESKGEPIKPKRGKKMQLQSPEGGEQIKSSVLKQENSKTRSKKGNRRNVNSSNNEIMQNNEDIVAKTPCKTPDQFSDNSGILQTESILIGTSNETKIDALKKRKRINSATENSSDTDIPESKFSNSDQNKSKRKKGVQPHENDVSHTTKTTVVDKPKKRGKKDKRQLPIHNDATTTQELTDSAETSDSNKCSRLSVSLPDFTNESPIVQSEKQNSQRKKHSSNENNIDQPDTLAAEGETGDKSLQGPIRSSTFILSDSDIAGETDEMPVPVPRRYSTFILLDTDGRSPQRRSCRLSPGPAYEKKTTNQNAVKIQNHGKSIGNRIMQNLAKKGAEEKSSKKEPGSAVKKTITKNKTPGGSVFKKKPASRMPDFKKIHQHLFNNMESLSENKKRQLDRAQGLLQSPVVPRCALLTPKPIKAIKPESSPLRKEHNKNMRTSLMSPAAYSRNSPGPSRASVAPSPLATKLKTPVAPLKPITVPSSVNRFGFRRPVKKDEATAIIGKKLPTSNVNQKKEQERNLLKGVRMNKRFMLQMQMRQAVKESGK